MAEALRFAGVCLVSADRIAVGQIDAVMTDAYRATLLCQPIG